MTLGRSGYCLVGMDDAHIMHLKMSPDFKCGSYEVVDLDTLYGKFLRDTPSWEFEPSDKAYDAIVRYKMFSEGKCESCINKNGEPDALSEE